MIVIPGVLVAVATFPGVIIHEAAHMLFCKLRGIAILDVCFFRFGNPAGYVVHEDPTNFTSSFLISFGPFLVNSLLCVLICLPAVVPVQVFNVDDPLSWLLIWAGVSIGAHAFPSPHDATNVWTLAKIEARKWNPLAIISFPLVVLFIGGHVLSVVWFDVLYGIGLGLLLPEFILTRLL